MEQENNCSICHPQNKESHPAVWCPHCLESLCSSCEQQHRVQKLSRDHVTIPFEDYCKLPPFIRNVDLNCQDHNEKYQYFCRSHDVPCCVKCLSKTHKKCEDTPVIDDVVRNVKASAGFEDIWRELKATYETYKEAIETGEDNFRDISAKKKEFAKRIKERTNQLIDQLKVIENQTLSTLYTVVTETLNKIDTTTNSLRSKEAVLKSMIDKKTSIKSHASDFQAFIGIKHIENEIKESRESFQHMCKDGDLSKWEIVMEENGTIEDVFFGVKNLGDFKVLMEKTTTNQDMDQPNRAQMMVKKKVSPELKLTRKFKLEIEVCYGCCALPNGLMAFADKGNHDIKITRSDGSIKSRVKFGADKEVYDVTVFDDNHIAASNPKEQTISIINVDEGKVMKTLKTKCNVRGITHHDGYIYFTVSRKGIMNINIKTEKVENVHDDKFVGGLSRIDTDGKRLCYTCYTQNSVTVLDSDYKVIFTYKDGEILNSPIGISFDQHQNMLVGNNGKENILLISQDGNKTETLVTKEDGLIRPTGVHYCAETKSVVIICRAGDVRIYSV